MFLGAKIQNIRKILHEIGKYCVILRNKPKKANGKT